MLLRSVCVCGVRLWLINYTLVASSSRNVQAGTVQQTAVPSMSVINELFTFDLMNTLKLSSDELKQSLARVGS